MERLTLSEEIISIDGLYVSKNRTNINFFQGILSAPFCSALQIALKPFTQSKYQ
jgi:hypothetical protein